MVDIGTLHQLKFMEDLAKECLPVYEHLCQDFKLQLLHDGAFAVCERDRLSKNAHTSKEAYLLKRFANDIHDAFGCGIKTGLAIIHNLLLMIMDLIRHGLSCFTLAKCMHQNVDALENEMSVAQQQQMQVLPTCTACCPSPPSASHRLQSAMYSRHFRPSDNLQKPFNNIPCVHQLERLVHSNNVSLIQTIHQLMRRTSELKTRLILVKRIQAEYSSLPPCTLPHFELTDGAVLSCPDYGHLTLALSRWVGPERRFTARILLIRGNLQPSHLHIGHGNVSTVVPVLQSADSLLTRCQDATHIDTRWRQAVLERFTQLGVNLVLLSGSCDAQLQDDFLATDTHRVLCVPHVDGTTMRSLSLGFGIALLDYPLQAASIDVSEEVNVQVQSDISTSNDKGNGVVLCVSPPSSCQYQMQTLVCTHMTEHLGAVGLEKWQHEWCRVHMCSGSSGGSSGTVTPDRSLVPGGGTVERLCAQKLTDRAKSLRSNEMKNVEDEEDYEITGLEMAMVMEALAASMLSWAERVESYVVARGKDPHLMLISAHLQKSIWRWSLDFVLQCLQCRHVLVPAEDSSSSHGRGVSADFTV